MGLSFGRGSNTSAIAWQREMKPLPPSESTRKRMVHTRRRDTPLEVALRRKLWLAGLRYRIDAPMLRELRRRGDIVFSRARVAVHVDGCFWHGCPQHATFPKYNGRWWSEKLQQNRERDRDTDAALEANGWISVRVWGHERDIDSIARAIESIVRRRIAEPGAAGATGGGTQHGV